MTSVFPNDQPEDDFIMPVMPAEHTNFDDYMELGVVIPPGNKPIKYLRIYFFKLLIQIFYHIYYFYRILTNLSAQTFDYSSLKDLPRPTFERYFKSFY